MCAMSSIVIIYLRKHHCPNCSGHHYPYTSSSFDVFSFPRPPSSFYLVQPEVMRTWKRIVRSKSWTKNLSFHIPLVRLWTGVGHICEWVEGKLWQPHLQQLVQLLLQFLRVSVDLRFSGVEQETVAEHLAQIRQERPDAAVLVVILIVQPLLYHVQGYRIFDLLQILGKVEISAVPGR